MYTGDIYVIKEANLGVNELAIYSFISRYKHAGYEVSNVALSYVYNHFNFNKIMTELEFVESLEKLSNNDLLDISFFEGKINIRINDCNINYMLAQTINNSDNFYC